MRKANNKIIGFAALSCFSLGVLTSLTNNDAFVFELHNKGAKFVTKVDPEIEGVYASKLTVPSDPVYNTQKSYSMSNVGDIESVWNTTTGKGTTIAVIDDGFAPKHEDYLRADGTSAILPTSRYYYTSNSSVAYKQYSQDASCLNEGWNSTYSELDTHGTNTSSTAAAPMQGKGGVGIAPDADLLLIKIDMSFAAIKSAIQYCIDQKVDVINMSLGAYSSSFKDGFGTQQSGSSSVATYLDSVCVNAYNAGVIVVAAAGNEATSNKSYPACNSHVVGVGALNKGSSTELAPFTNFNSSVSQGDEKNVDILAPGYVYTAKVEATSSTGSWTYTYGDTMGTSFSSPIVAGAASLWCQKNAGQYTGSAKVDAFQKALTSTADGIGDFATRTVAPSKLSSYYSKYGPYTSNIACGTLNVKNLVGEVSQGGSEEVQVTSLTMNKSSLVLDEGATGQLSVTANAGASNAVTWSSSNSAVAKVSANGLVTAVKEGSAVITATSTLNSNVKATCNVTVNKVEEGEEPQVKSSVISMPKFSSNGST
ncbi:MAG: S8 family serine peptidase, partial [Bacilli bacterium]|nr:S8 family serine peptidase [Bacilli bacterium]